jgi:hypothetical protein
MKGTRFLGLLATASLSLLIGCGGGNDNGNSNTKNYNLNNTANVANKISNVAGNVANSTSNAVSTVANKIGNTADKTGAIANNARANNASGTIRGNKNSHLYHLSNCPDYDKISKDNIVNFATRAEAEHAGYHVARNCPGEEGSRTSNKSEPKNDNRAATPNKNTANTKSPQVKH